MAGNFIVNNVVLNQFEYQNKIVNPIYYFINNTNQGLKTPEEFPVYSNHIYTFIFKGSVEPVPPLREAT